jgi:hypothetical protein
VEEAWQFGIHEEQIEQLFPLGKQLLLAVKLGVMVGERLCQFF